MAVKSLRYLFRSPGPHVLNHDKLCNCLCILISFKTLKQNMAVRWFAARIVSKTIYVVKSRVSTKCTHQTTSLQHVAIVLPGIYAMTKCLVCNKQNFKARNSIHPTWLKAQKSIFQPYTFHQDWQFLWGQVARKRELEWGEEWNKGPGRWK